MTSLLFEATPTVAVALVELFPNNGIGIKRLPLPVFGFGSNYLLLNLTMYSQNDQTLSIAKYQISQVMIYDSLHLKKV